MKSKEQKVKKQARKNRGITLIALVVTIVVLLILAAVSIAMLGGENGIITQAIKAQEENEIAEEKEKVQLAATAARTKNNWGEITQENLEEELDKNIGSGKYTLTNNGETFTVTYKDSNRSYEVDANGNVTEAGENPGGGTGEITPGNRYDEDTDITIGDDKVTIPGGSTISKIPGEYESIDDGLVIYIIPKGETPDWTADTNGNGIKDVQEKYDQFVWVPVKNAVLDLSANTEALASDANIKAEVQKEIDAGRYPMAIKKDATNYIGVLYEFAEESGTVKVRTNTYWTPITMGTYREPDVVPSYDNNTSFLNQINGILNTSYSDSTSLKNDLQTDFNNMVSRVEEKKGFWVGRYETSKMSNTTTETYAKSNEIQVGVKRGTTTGISNVTWYRMYAQQKIYKKLSLIESTSVISSMIWGSQWDQIMIWMKNLKNEYKSSYYVINSLGMGNYRTSDDSDSDLAQTGNSNTYKSKNLFDLAGNLYEWTIEANTTIGRNTRGRILLYF